MSLKANILIDKDGHAHLSDFGITSITQGDNSTFVAQDPDMTDTTTWKAPEILRGGAMTKEGDVFTFAIVVVEVGVRVFDGSSPTDLPWQDFHRACHVCYELPSGSG